MRRLEPLTVEHLEMFHVEPCGEFNGLALEDDGRVVAIGGYMDHGETLQLFSYSDGPPPVMFYRGCLQVLDQARETGKPAYALQDRDHPTSAGLLARLGLTRLGELQGEIVWRLDHG